MIKALRVQNIRAHKDYFIEFGENTSVVVGPNASGKTTLIEAIYLCLLGKGFKGPVKDLLAHNSEWARIDLTFGNNDVTIVKIKEQNGKLQKEFTVNGKTKSRLTFSDKSPVVIFEPEDLRLISGSPQRRRDYLDRVIVATDHTYGSVVGKYKKVLQQRNHLLKNNAADKDFFAWDVQLSECADVIVKLRNKLVLDLCKIAPSVYGTIANPDDKIHISYKPSTTNLMSSLSRSLARDRVVGSTGFGPHKDDLVIEINGADSRSTASRGEVRTIVLSLKSAEFEILKNQSNNPPVLLLDDVFSELDGKRRRALTKLTQETQTIITTTDADLALAIDQDSDIKPIS